VHTLVDRCFALIASAVHRFEGTINQYTGDGVMALFGAPIAHEDAPRRAAHAALAIQGAIRDLSRELAPRLERPLQMRIGLNTGPVVVGKIGDDLRMDYTAVGDTTNVAARLQQNARPGSVLVGASTHRLLAGYFETVDLGALTVKGHAPVQAFEVLRARGRKARLDVETERGLTPLVGRDREIATLMEVFGRVHDGQGQVVFVTGEAGIGKSRLVLEFRRRLAADGEPPTWLEGRCVSFGQSSPLLPVVDQLRENFRIDEFDGEPEIIAKVEQGMRQLGGLESHAPFVRYLLSVDPGDPAVTAMDGARRRKSIFEAVLAMSLRGATRRPLVFVFEDLHWVDTSTEEYLGALIDSIAATRILIVATHRLGYSPPFGTRSFQTRLTLNPLSESDALTMAGRMLGAERFPADVTRALIDKAEGVPLFVEEVTKTFLDLGILERDNGGFRVVRPIGNAAIPDTIHDIIMARLDRLGEEGKRTVQLASVIGRQFLRRLLERIAGLTGELEGLLQELKALEIIYEQSRLPEPNRPTSSSTRSSRTSPTRACSSNAARSSTERSVARSKSCIRIASPTITRSWRTTSSRVSSGTKRSDTASSPVIAPPTRLPARRPAGTMRRRLRSPAAPGRRRAIASWRAFMKSSAASCSSWLSSTPRWRSSSARSPLLVELATGSKKSRPCSGWRTSTTGVTRSPRCLRP
jgi:AAA ATPase domain/Adenylate and Guanylate cyclase catalytic domain